MGATGVWLAMAGAGLPPAVSRAIWSALWAAVAGILICLALLVRETPYTVTAFMFLGQPLLVVAFVLLAWRVVRDLRGRGLL